MGAGGFQLSARDDAGAQAGMLRAISPRVWTAEHGGVTYAQQTRPGAVAADSAAWQLEWTAPASATVVHFHLAGNAANGDDSAFGDHVYTASRVVAPMNDSRPSAEASRP